MFSNDERLAYKHDIDGFDGIENGIFQTSAKVGNCLISQSVQRFSCLMRTQGTEYVKKKVPICMVLNDRWNQFYVHHAQNVDAFYRLYFG